MRLLIAAVCTAQVVASLAASLREHYVFANAGAKMAAAIEAKSYDGLSGDELAAALTRDLRAISNDAHLHVTATPTETTGTARAAQEKGRNFGFRSVEILPGNIGVLDLRGFDRPTEAMRAKAAAAFELLKDADALIIDLRANGGGNPDGVALIASYVLDGPTLLAEMHHRDSGNEPLRSPERPANALRHGVPLVLLTSHKTFSAGEGLAFILQHLGRAKVVGERTAGAAHAGREEPLACGFAAVIPNTAVVLPGTEIDWETTGVTPDVEVEASKALDAATALLRSAGVPPATVGRPARRSLGVGHLGVSVRRDASPLQAGRLRSVR